MGIFQNNLLAASAAAASAGGGAFYSHQIEQCVRFDEDAGDKIYRTPSSSGNRRTFTYSCWYKRGNLTTSQNQAFFSAGSSSSDFTMLYLDGTTDDIRWYDYDGSTDYGKAYELANAVIQSAFNYSNGYISSDDTTQLRAKIYGFQIMQMPTRVEETATGLGRYSIALSMMYRAV